MYVLYVSDSSSSAWLCVRARRPVSPIGSPHGGHHRVLHAARARQAVRLLKGGAEAAFAHVQHHLEINPTHLVGGNDLQSAYNEGDRSAMWDLLEGVPGLAGILAYVVAIYGVVASIVLERPGIGPLRVKNGTGYRQGCALAALLFCLRPIFSDLFSRMKKNLLKSGKTPIWLPSLTRRPLRLLHHAHWPPPVYSLQNRSPMLPL